MADGGPIRAFEISWNALFANGEVFVLHGNDSVWSKLDVLVLGGNVCGVYWLVLE